MDASAASFYALRLGPHADLKPSILEFASTHGIKAGVVLSCVGSLEQANTRFANQKSGTLIAGPHEILSLNGTVSENSLHLHIAIADGAGRVTGGHLLQGSLVYTTAEIVIAELTGFAFHRETDPAYGYQELVVKKRL